MNSLILFAVLTAALFHASWNFLVKNTGNKSVAILAISIGQVPFGIAGLFYTGLPPYEAFGHVFISGLLHTGYMIFLMQAYRFGDLSVVYPIARGVSPILLTLATFILLQDRLSPLQIYGTALIAGALILLGASQYRASKTGYAPVLLAMVTGFFIASYSMVDALGTRIGQDAFGFFGCVAIMSAILMSGYFTFDRKVNFKELFTAQKTLMIMGGGISYTAYIIVLWACLYAPISVVSSLRETSTFFAVMIGVFVLKETLSVSKILSSLLIIIGIVFTKLG